MNPRHGPRVAARGFYDALGLFRIDLGAAQLARRRGGEGGRTDGGGRRAVMAVITKSVATFAGQSPRNGDPVVGARSRTERSMGAAEGDVMETLFAFLAGAATAGATALLAPRVRGVDLSKSMAPVRKVFVGTIAAAYRVGDAVAGATAGARKEISKVVDEGRDRARAAERPVAELPAAPEPHTP